MTGKSKVLGAVVLVLVAVPIGSSEAATTASGRCTLPAYDAPVTQGATDSGYTTCIASRLSISSPPVVGQTATLTAEVQADSGVSGRSSVVLQVPPGVTLMSRPAGFESVAVPSGKTDGTVVRTASGSVTLVAGQTARVTFKVKPTAVGLGRFRVLVSDPSGRFSGSQSSLYLHWGRTAAASGVGLGLGSRGQLAAAPQGVVPVEASSAGTLAPSAGNGAGGTVRAIRRTGHAAATACVVGKILFNDPNGVWRALKWGTVQVFDRNDSSPDVKIAQGLSAKDGSFKVCFPTDETSPTDSPKGTADVYVGVLLETRQFSVTDTSGVPYSFLSTTRADVPAGVDLDMGKLTPSGEHYRGAFRAYDVLTSAYGRLQRYKAPGLQNWCWDEHNTSDSQCRAKMIEWEPDLNVWPHMNPVGEDGRVQLPGAGPDYPDVVGHELGHLIMNDVYDGNWPDEDSCPKPHYVDAYEGVSCAWSEGFATGLGSYIVQTDTLGWWNGSVGTVNTLLEDLTWRNSDFGYGERVESRVATAIRDLYDSTNEAPWDRWSNGFDAMWRTFQNHDSKDFAKFVGDMGTDGVDVGSSEFRSTLYANTIELNGADPWYFIEPAVLGSTYTRDTPHTGPGGAPWYTGVDWPRSSDFFYATKQAECMVLTLKPQGNAQLQLSAHDSKAANSSFDATPGGKSVQQLFVPTGQRVGNYIVAEVSDFAPVHPPDQPATGGYSFAMSNCSFTLGAGTSTTLDAGTLASAFGLTVHAGRKATVKISPKGSGSAAGTGDAALKVVKTVQGQTAGTSPVVVATADSAGSGRPETLTFTPPVGETAAYVLSVVSKSGKGAYTLTFSEA